MIQIVVAGAAGRMGRQIIAAALDSDQIELAGGFERPGHPALGQDLGPLAGEAGCGLSLADSLAQAIQAAPGKAEVIIDFTAPEATLANLAQAVEAGLAGVVGTTGFSPQQRAEIARLAKTRPVVLAPNMSVGVNILFKVAGEVARRLGPGYDMEIIEAHHRRKKDAPSGTALRLAEVLAQARNWRLEETGCFARHGQIGQRPEAEIGVQAIRAGDIVGDHTVIFAGPGERLELTHRAHSRLNFAQGAMRAACWVMDQAPGLYDMQDVLGLS
ncbi:MAG: 4-hydroxy-tetrahydrodipicolinate reductase [Deltaproteobacteria bacterium]|nr:4-hydroxy-tetrahydrodipicolinate reductase [Deltaproteobacteria bacterium]